MSSEQEGGAPNRSEPALPRVTEDGMTTSEMNTVLISRYRVQDYEGARVVVAEDAPGIRLFIIPGLVATDEDRRNYPENTIFLDGAYGGAPFLDNELRQYSFDHHEGCVRPFTLSTCEQAAVMLTKGLPLSEGEWRLYVNQPDLDALLAAWVLMNHRELTADGAAQLQAVMPMIRVEGLIDSHGLEVMALSGLNAEDYATWKGYLDQLMLPEREHRTAGSWDSLDLVAYSSDRLAAIDALLSAAGLLRERAQVEVVSTRDIQQGKQVIFCRSSGGIYEVEARLRELYGSTLGVVILETGEGRFTLKQVDPFLSRDLVAFYQTLNARDDKAESQGESGANLWGGSADIGGSPRATGSALGPDEILDIAARVYRGTSWFKRLLGKKR